MKALRPRTSEIRPRGRSRGRRRANSLESSTPGFTLIELMVVVVIIGLMSGVAFVSWEAIFPNQAFNSAVHRLSDVLHGKRSEAIARNREFRIYYDIDNDSYSVRTPYLRGGGFATAEDDDADRVWVDSVDLSENGIDLLQVTLDDIVFTDGVVYVRFDPLGASSYHSVVLRQSLFDREFTIEALPLTGEIRFHEGFFERDLATEKDFD